MIDYSETRMCDHRLSRIVPMNFSELNSTGFAAGEGIDQDEYRAVSKLAIAALVMGVAAPLVLIGPLLAVVPILGIVVAWVALRRVADSGGELVGRGATLIGLALSITCLMIAPSRHVAVSWYLHREARPWAERWFELLANDQPHRAHQLTLAGNQRSGPDEHLWDVYRNNPQKGVALQEFVESPLVRAVLALGDRAEVIHWDNVSRQSMAGQDYVVQNFAVSYHDNGQKKTFIGRLTMSRETNELTGDSNWRVTNFEGGVSPAIEPIGS